MSVLYIHIFLKGTLNVEIQSVKPDISLNTGMCVLLDAHSETSNQEGNYITMIKSLELFGMNSFFSSVCL